ncbi:MAG: hypothetical protein AB1757_11190 [Acidobacteriota bacterium]
MANEEIITAMKVMLDGFKDDFRYELRAVEQRLNDKIDSVEQRLNDKIDGVQQQLNDKIDLVEQQLSDKIDSVEQQLNDKIDGVHFEVKAISQAVIETSRKVKRIEEDELPRIAALETRVDRIEKSSS